jgi:hypothetical protein
MDTAEVHTPHRLVAQDITLQGGGAGSTVHDDVTNFSIYLHEVFTMSRQIRSLFHEGGNRWDCSMKDVPNDPC